MSKWIYQTPDKKYAIANQQGFLFESLFGYRIIGYLLCKYDKSVKDYYIFRSEEKLEDCFRWLEKKSIITKQEADEQIKLWS